MELVKREDHWALYNEDGHKIAATIRGCKSKLSLKNCQAIERGYDLDELAENYSIGKSSSDVFKEAHKKDFIAGAKAILAILGDKKYSEDDIKKAIAFDQYHFEYGEITSCKKDEEKEEFIQSLQQTEFDVEIEMECPQCKDWGYVDECRNNCNKKFLQQKLDENGCLILKRIV